MDLASALRRAVVSLEESLREAQQRAARLSKKLESEGLLRSLRPAASSAKACGVDGHLVKLAEVPSRALYALRAAGIVVEGPSKVVHTHVLEDVVVVERSGDEDAFEAAQLLMMRLEVECLSSLSLSCRAALLDGPIADPPILPRSPIARRAAPNYHEWRAERMLEASKRILVAGYVKRPRPECFAEIGAARPEEITLALIHALEDEGWEAAVLGPLTPTSEVHKVYAELGLNLEACYVLTPWWRHARKIEAPHGKCLEAASLVMSFLLRGLQHPVPVQLAHELASRLHREVEVLRAALAAELKEKNLAVLFLVDG